VRLVVIAIVLAACSYGDPSYDGTGFKCDGDHPCPSGQTCGGDGVCGTGGSGSGSSELGIKCGADTCAAGSACCADVIAGPHCISTSASCTGQTAQCDGIADCGSGQRCCATASPRCGADTCADAVCTVATDCPSFVPTCCFDTGFPWGHCGTGC
jgi:hypothetical protein